MYTYIICMNRTPPPAWAGPPRNKFGKLGVTPPFSPPEAARRGQEGAKTSQECSKRPPRRPLNAPRRSKRA